MPTATDEIRVVEEAGAAEAVAPKRPPQRSRWWSRSSAKHSGALYAGIVIAALLAVVSFVIVYFAVIAPADTGRDVATPVDGAESSATNSPSAESPDFDVPSSGGGGVMASGVYKCVGSVAADRTWRGEDGADHAGGCSELGGLWDAIMDWFSSQRRFLLALPPQLEQPAPLVLLAPGTGRNPQDQLEIAELQALSRAQGFAVAVLEGEDDALNVAKDARPGEGWDDVSYALAIVRAVHALAPGGVDARRVFCTGHSRGARFCSMLAAQLSPLVAAIAPVGGLRFPLPNDGTRPVPVISFHGLDDATNPYDGGGREYWGTSVPDAVQKWAVFNGCNETSTTYYDNGVTLEARTECAEDAEVHSYSISGGGHTWPGSSWSFGWGEGAEMPEPDATREAWRFFEAHPLPEVYAQTARVLIQGRE